jgi:hypothetical protein
MRRVSEGPLPGAAASLLPCGSGRYLAGSEFSLRLMIFPYLC